MRAMRKQQRQTYSGKQAVNRQTIQLIDIHIHGLNEVQINWYERVCMFNYVKMP